MCHCWCCTHMCELFLSGVQQEFAVAGPVPGPCPQSKVPDPPWLLFPRFPLTTTRANERVYLAAALAAGICLGSTERTGLSLDAVGADGP